MNDLSFGPVRCSPCAAQKLPASSISTPIRLLTIRITMLKMLAWKSSPYAYAGNNASLTLFHPRVAQRGAPHLAGIVADILFYQLEGARPLVDHQPFGQVAL